jgi:YT521-B-like domain
VDELFAFFSRLPKENDERTMKNSNTSGSSTPSIDSPDPTIPAHGVLSIFIITRSSCAFINYATPRHLERALVFFQGQSLRPEDPRCPKLVCRVRKKDDEAQAGVAGQRGRGIHVAWLKEHERKAKEESQTLHENDENTQQLVAPQALKAKAGIALDKEDVKPDVTEIPTALTPTPQRTNISYSSQQRPSIDSSSGGSGSISLASTNSSLFRHPAFRERFFILKSLRVEDLDQSVKDGTWATQAHNEAVLDQAYRNSESVYLIFSANQSGGFYGYARMAGPINAPTDRNATIRPDSIPEGDESVTGFQQKLELPPQTLTDLGGAYLSPLQMTPSSEGHDDALSIQNINSVSLNVSQKTQEKRGPQRSTISSTPSVSKSERVDTVSPPTNFIAKSTAAPPVTVIAKTPDASTRGVAETLNPTLQVADSAAAIVISPSTEEERELFSSELDPDRTNQRGNRIPPTRQTVSLGSTNSEPLKGSPKILDSNGDNNSIGPNESASYPTDARTQSQLAIKALIHNLRLDEKESVHRAKQLEAVEAEMKAKDQSGLNDSPDADSSTVQTTIKPQPLASSPETWGKSFKVEWIKVYPISFSSVRRLRNPWRDDRQIKVSRDGTELEPNVGRQLLDEWRKAEKEGNSSSKVSIASGNADEEEEEDDDE